MTGLLVKKYHIAILNTESDFVSKMVETLKQWYNNKVVIRTYTDSYSMFEAVNVNKAKNKPFDMAVIGPSQLAERLVLQRANPSLKIVVCSDETSLHREVSKVLL